MSGPQGFSDKVAFVWKVADKVADLIADRHEANGMLLDLYFSNPEFQTRLLRYRAETCEEFRAEA